MIYFARKFGNGFDVKIVGALMDKTEEIDYWNGP